MRNRDGRLIVSVHLVWVHKFKHFSKPCFCGLNHFFLLCLGNGRLMEKDISMTIVHIVYMVIKGEPFGFDLLPISSWYVTSIG